MTTNDLGAASNDNWLSLFRADMSGYPVCDGHQNNMLFCGRKLQNNILHCGPKLQNNMVMGGLNLLCGAGDDKILRYLRGLTCHFLGPKTTK